VVNIGRWSTYEGGQLDRFYCILVSEISVTGGGEKQETLQQAKLICLEKF
jgi:hypothetical protein